MTDERAPEPQAGGTVPEGGSMPDAAPPAPPAPPADAAPDQPPPLAPLVEGTAAPPPPPPAMDDTAAQPTSSWQAPAAPPPIPPPAAQPAVAWAPPPAAPPAQGGVTGWAKAAGVLLVIGGILGGLAGLAVAVFGSAVVEMIDDMGQIPDVEGLDPRALVTGTIVFFGIIILIYSLVYLIGGIGVLRSRNWGRVLGLIAGILSGLIWLGSVTTPDVPGARDSTIGSLIAFGIHAYIVIALIFFWRRPAAT